MTTISPPFAADADADARPADAAAPSPADAEPLAPATGPTADAAEPASDGDGDGDRPAAPDIDTAPAELPAAEAPSLEAAPSSDPPAAEAAPLAPVVAEMTAAACGAALGERFPALFGRTPKPLKLRIQVDIQARAPGVFTRKSLSAFLHRYTGSHAYLSAVAQAHNRFDLDGQPCAELSAEHRQVAVDELARRRANRDAQRRLEDEQRALEEQQRRNRAGLLRDHETTTLTRANFCALKGVAEAELDGLLLLARQEAAERRQAAPPPHRPGPGPRPGPSRGPARPRSGPARSGPPR